MAPPHAPGPGRRPSGDAPPDADAALTVGALADATPAHRDRVVDLLRAVSIGVVVLWHWAGSVLHWGDGALRMPNPVGDVPGLWAATWLLQVMPLFFLVGGYANLAGWEAVTRSGGGARAFLSKRIERLGRPVAAYLATWLVADVALQAGGGRSVLDWGMVVFVPLWFLGVYVGVVLLVPLTARWHAARPGLAVAILGAGVGVAEVARLAHGVEVAGLVGSASVWVLCHQLGYWWRDGSLVARGPRCAAALAAGGVAGLALLTGPGPYPRSMVTVRGEEVGNMFPTSACIVALAVLQLGVVLLARPYLARWLEGRRPWRAVVAANAVAMTVFCWHMTALVIVVGAYELAGFRLGDRPTAAWWLARPLWVILPGLVLACLVTLYARFELPRPRRVTPRVR